MPLRRLAREGGRAAGGGGGPLAGGEGGEGGGAGEAAQEVGAGGVEVEVAVEGRGQIVDLVEAARRALGHGDRDRAVERDDRRVVERGEAVIPRGDAVPARVGGGRRAGVLGGDRGLEGVRAGLRSGGERAIEQREALGDLRAVPAGAILIGEEHELA